MIDIYHNGEMYTPRKNLQKAENRIKKIEAELNKFKEPVEEIPQFKGTLDDLRLLDIKI